MRTRSSITRLVLPIMMAIGTLAGSQSAAAASEPHPMLAQNGQGRLSYVDKAAGPAIASYATRLGTETSAANTLIVYVDQAYGQAIYSYPGNAPDITTAFNVEYVNSGFGQAIYSYPRVGLPEGTVKILDIISAPSN